MPTIAALTSFTANTQAKAAEVNANFSSIRTTVNTYAAFVDSTATITGAWTFSTAPVFTNAQTFAAGVTITTGGLTVTAGGLTVTAGGVTATGNSTITGTLGGLTGLTVASGGATITGAVNITGAVTATSFAGSGASLTSLPAAQLTGTLPALAAGSLTGLNASEITSGTLNTARLPSAITGISSLALSSLTFPNNGSEYFRITGSSLADTLMDADTNNPTWVTTTAPGGSSTTRYLKIGLGGAIFLLEAKSEI